MARLSYNEIKQQKARENKRKYLSNKGSLKTIKKVWHYARPYRIFMYLTLLTDLIASITEIFIPIFMGKAINCAVGAGLVDFKGITINLVLMLIMVLLTAIFNYLSTLCVNAFAYKTSFRFRELFFKKMNTVPLNYIDTNSHGDLLSRMVNDIDLVCDGFLESIASLLSGLTTIIGTIVAMYILNFKMATIILVLTPMSIVIAWIIVKKSKKYFKMEVQTEGQLSGYLEEYISGERVVKMFGHEEETIKDFAKINQNYYEVGEKSQFYGNLTNPATRFVNGIVYGVVGLVGALLVLGGEPNFSIGVISSFLSYANSFGRPFNEISSEISDIQTAFAAAA
ncbi:MAG: ABC transporter ATP-binding protein, partial [Clostridia bacterium]|nr:ABC transporter ATP-binding protein [Clostridia bacterium]